MNKGDKIVFLLLSGILALVAVCLFCKAIICEPQPDSTQEIQVHVFINQNDSIVNYLQKDVEHLTSIIEEMQADTLVIKMHRP